MKFYHRTTEEAWSKIQEEGVLCGVTNSYRYTYLAPEKCYADESFGSVFLEVEYEPRGVGVKDEDGGFIDNYGFDPPPGQICWQFSVFKPIPLSQVKRIKGSV